MGRYLQSLVFILFAFCWAHAEEESSVGVNLDEMKKQIKKEAKDFEPLKPESKDKKFEKIEVTGSHIKRIDVEGPSPVLTIDQDDITRSGFNSVSDILRNVGASSFGSFREHSGQVGAGTAAVNLRGLGQVRTLVLLNGQRLPTDAASGAVDLNIIPMGAVERIDILKDGASAIYGSDALGGVVNIITKKNFSGTEINLMNSATEMRGGERRSIGITNGYNKGRLSMTNVAYFRHNERILSQDRPWSKYGRSTYSTDPSYKKDGDSNYTPSASCDPSMVLADGRCSYNFGDENWEMPYVTQGSVMNEMNYEISDNLTAFSRFSYSYKQSEWSFAPAYTDSLMAEDPNNPGEKVRVRMRIGELGNRRSNSKTNAGMALVGMRGYLGDSTWDWETNLSYNKIDRKERRQGYILMSDLQKAVDNGTYRPLDPNGDRGSLTGLSYDPQQNSVSENTYFNAKASGELGDIGAGPVMMAIGVSALRELYRDAADNRTLNGDVINIASSAGGGARNSLSAYSELSTQFVENLESVAALRYDHFDGFGSTVNPKLGFRYLPWKEVMFRSSVGTGFKAPQMQKLFSAQTAGRSGFVDQVACNELGGSACNFQQNPVVIGGNKDLKQERSLSFNLGTVIQPTKTHSFGVDFWYYNIKDQVEETDYGALTRAEAAGVDISKYGASATRDPVTKELIGQGLYAPYLNISSTETQGIDVNYDGKVMTTVGDFRLRFRHSHMIYYKTEPFPGNGVIDRIGLNGRPQWRNNTTLFYAPNANHEFSLLARTIASNAKRIASRGRYPTYTELDLRYSLDVASLDGRFTFGIRNLLGSIPPFDDSNPYDADINFRLYNERGRSAYLGYKQVF